MKRGHQNDQKIKGVEPVAVLSDLSTEEHLAVYYFRITFEAPSVLMDIHRQLCTYLGEEAADKRYFVRDMLPTKITPRDF